jgi:hypothetical protein
MDENSPYLVTLTMDKKHPYRIPDRSRKIIHVSLDTWSQSYDRDLHRQRYKKLQRQE